MNKQKVKEMIKFSVNKSIQNKWFALLNIVILLITVFASNTDNIKKFLENNNINLFTSETIIEVVDNENIGFEKIKEGFQEEGNVEVKKIDKNNYTEETIGDNTIVIELKKDRKDIVKAYVISKDRINTFVEDIINESIAEVRAELFSKQYIIPLNELEIMNEEVAIERIMLSVDAENSETKEMIKYVSTFAVYMISIFVFTSIANEIAQEKVSKSIEYVLTSVTAKEYLLAKVVSIIAVIMLQAVYTVIYYVIGNAINSLINIAQIEASNGIDLIETMKSIDTEIVLYIITVFGYGLLTLILMTIIQAAISSKTTSMSEASNTVALLTMITIFAYIFTLSLITPETNMTLFIYAISCIPLLSNYFVPAILVIGQATPALIIVSLVLLIISIPVSFNICSKIFKNGVLNYNTKQKSSVKRKTEKTFKEEQELKFRKEKYKKFSFVIGLAMILYLVTQNLGQTILGVTLLPFIKDFFTNAQLELIITLILSICSSLIAIFTINIYKNKNDVIQKKKLKLNKKLEIIFIGIFALLIFQLLTTFVTNALGIDYSVNTVIFENSENNFIVNILITLVVVIQAPILEELLFRKAFIDYSKKFGTVFSIIISATFFGLVHGNISQFIFAFSIGILFGTIYALTGNISLTIILHLLNNGYATIVTLLENNPFALKILDITILVIAFLGLLCLIKMLVKNKNNIKNNIKTLKENKLNLKEYKYIFFDFSFVTATFTLILLFALTEKMLSIM